VDRQEKKRQKRIARKLNLVNKDLCGVTGGLCKGMCRKKYAYNEKNEPRCMCLYRLEIVKARHKNKKKSKDEETELSNIEIVEKMVV